MEDAALLALKSVPASHLALIDSSKRDQAHFPTPSRFDVAFDTPFRMVYGMDLLSVTIPRTEYNVSSSRNVLTFSFGQPNGGQRHVLSVLPGDYDGSTIVTAITNALAKYVSASNNTIAVSSAGPFSNQVVFTCPEPFTFYLSNSSLRQVVGLSYPVDPGYTGYAAPGWSPGSPDTVCSVLSPIGPGGLTAFAGPVSGGGQLTIVGESGVQQTFISTYPGVITSVGVVLSYVGTDPNPVVYWTVKTLNDSVIANGVITADFDVSSHMSSGGYTNMLAPLVAGQTYVLQLTDPYNADASNCTVAAYGSDPVEGAVALAQSGAVNGTLCASITVQSAQYVLQPPGLIDLTGERYIVLRCLEIETAINGSRAFEGYNAGIGYIQLGTYGYSQQAYDYTAYPPRSFQPIPSLYKLSLSFEKPDGTLYDFKGLNLQLLMLIRYYVPKQPSPNNSKIPHYNPDLPKVNSNNLQTVIQNDRRYAWCPQSPLDLSMHGNATLPGRQGFVPL